VTGVLVLVVWLLVGHCWLTRGGRLREGVAGPINGDNTAAYSSNLHIFLSRIVVLTMAASIVLGSQLTSSAVGLKVSIVLATLPSRVEQTVRRTDTNLQRAG